SKDTFRRPRRHRMAAEGQRRRRHPGRPAEDCRLSAHGGRRVQRCRGQGREPGRRRQLLVAVADDPRALTRAFCTGVTYGETMERKRLVLVVEDSPAFRNALAKDLASDGLEVLLAGDYRAAVALLERVVPDLVCVDLTLPRESGFELIEY